MQALPDLRERSREPELLDFGGVPAAEVEASLADIRFVNDWLGGHRTFERLLRPFLRGEAPLSLLDVGCGSADLPARLLRRHGQRRLRVVGLDLKPGHLRHTPPEVHRVAGDVFAPPFAERSFDVVACSLFLHHLDGADVSRALAGLWRLARRALVVNDLRRAQVPHAFARLVFPRLFRSPVSVYDGLVSIRRSFTPRELRAAFLEAGLPDPVVRRVFPYRLAAVAVRRDP
jgi:ubiquinone/menaquinone biosynthesis C-methylase UbiE